MSHYWFISTKYRSNSKLALFTCALALVVILLGAYTRLTDAGLSCPDWPNCFGYVTAPHTAEQLQGAAAKYPTSAINVKKAWTEMTHRYFAGTEGILILILSASILFTGKARNKKATFIGIGLIALLGVQVALGMLTVTEKLKPVIVLSHLITGISILSMLWWAYLSLNLRDDSFIKNQNPRVKPLLWLGFFIIAAQITLGGWVSTHYAGLACIDFPYCNGKLMPDMQWNQLNTDLISIHMLHRIGAFVTAVYISFLGLYLIANPAFKSLAKLLLALVALQLTLGILNIIWLRPVWIAMFHQGTAIILLLTLITMLVKAAFTMEGRYVSAA